MVTLGVALVLREIANRLEITGGADGLQGVVMEPVLGHFAFDIFGKTAYVYSLIVLFVLFVIARRIVNSPFGLSLRSVRGNSLRASAIGIHVNGRLVAVYTIAAAYAGVAGALLTQATQFASLSVLDFERSADVMLMLIIGGTGYLYGGMIGAVLFKVVQDYLANVTPQYWHFWLGLMLVMMIMFGRVYGAIIAAAIFGICTVLKLRLHAQHHLHRRARPGARDRASAHSAFHGEDHRTRERAAGAASGRALPANRERPMPPVLETKGLDKHFGGIVATDNVSLSVEKGARHALIGPNGAGKTTIINLLTGVLRPTAGTIFLEGRDITNLEAYKRVRLGIARTFQINQLFADLTPLETIGLAVSERMELGRQWWRLTGSKSIVIEESVDILSRFNLADVMSERTGTLPYGKQRLLEIALAIACRPHVLLLDEPAAGVPEAERHGILDAVAALPSDVTVLLIEHDMDIVFSFADRISVLVNGALFVEGAPEEVAADPRVKAVYLGEEAHA